LGHAESKGGTDVHAGDPYGIVTGLSGPATGITPGGSRELRIGDRVAVGEEVFVAAGTLEILWERRALFSLEGRTRIAVREAKNGLALLDILEGAVQIAFSYNEGHPTDTVTIQTPAARTVLRGGIVEAKVAPTGEIGRLVQSAHVGKTASTAGELLRMIEGQAQIEPRTAGAKSFLLKVGHEFQTTSQGDAVRPSLVNDGRKLILLPGHQQMPSSAVQRMVRTHVDHAVEVERAINKPSRGGNEMDGPARDKSGAIVSTSLGIPIAALPGSGGATASSSLAPAMPPGPLVSGGGATTAAPPAPVPIIQTPTVTILTPTQSGGINSQSLLREVLQDLGGSKGKAKGHAKD
jgi:hypothetical protein